MEPTYVTMKMEKVDEFTSRLVLEGDPDVLLDIATWLTLAVQMGESVPPNEGGFVG